MLRVAQSFSTPRPLTGLLTLQCRHSGWKYTIHNRSALTPPTDKRRKHPTLRQLITYLDEQKSGGPKPAKPIKRRRKPQKMLGKGHYVDTSRFVGFSQFVEHFTKEHEKASTDRTLTDAEIAAAVESFQPRLKRGQKAPAPTAYTPEEPRES